MGRTIPPLPLSRAALNKRYRHLRMEYPDRVIFRTEELDPNLHGWLKEQRFWWAIRFWVFFTSPFWVGVLVLVWWLRQ